jgi:hypothetical protein
MKTTTFTTLFAIFGLSCASQAELVFDTGFDYAGGAPSVGIDANNINGADGQVGSWSGNVPLADMGDGGTEAITFVDFSADTHLRFDRPGSNPATISADLSRNVDLPGTTVGFQIGTRRTSGSHVKDIHIVGFSSGGLESFHLIAGAVSGGIANEIGRLGFVTDAGATTSWDVPTTIGNDMNGDFGFTTGIDGVRGIALSLSATGYIIDFTGANSWTSSVIAYNEAAPNLARVEFRLSGGNTAASSGMLLDDVTVNAIPEPGVASLLLFGIVWLRLIGRSRRTAAVK